MPTLEELAEKDRIEKEKATPPISTDQPKVESTEEDKKDRIIRAQQDVIREYNQKLSTQDTKFAELRAEIDGLKKQPERTKVEQDKDFFSSPTTVLDERDQRLINELNKIVAPLKEFASEVKSGTDLDKIKSRFRANPAYAEILDHPEAGQMVDRMLANQPINEGTVRAAVYAVKSAIDMGDITGVTLGKKAPDMSNMPPHLRPSAPSAPRSPSGPKRDYSENERRLMREMGISEEDWDSFGGGPETTGRDISVFRPTQFETPEEKRKREKGGK